MSRKMLWHWWEKENQVILNTTLLNNWRKTCNKRKYWLPGLNYFSSVEALMDSHLDEGPFYFEFHNCKYDSCDLWKEIPGISIDPNPPTEPDIETGHQKISINSVWEDSWKISFDEFQPRHQCSILFQRGKVSAINTEQFDNFFEQYKALKK